MESPKVLPRSGWTHQGGRFAGYCIGAEGIRRTELGMRAFEAEDAERVAARPVTFGFTGTMPRIQPRSAEVRGAAIAAVLAERERFGKARATAPVGGLRLGDAYQAVREAEAAASR